MADIATAYVQIIPTAEGIKGSLNNMLGGEAEGAGESAGKNFSGGFGKTVGTIAKVGAAAFGAAAAAAGALAKSAIEGYADFEQLSGGVETLFKDASDTVMKNAENAFRTAGMTANEYMETVTGFSASLLQSLGGDTEQAASVADMAISDMSDNANKMGTSMESIQAAYQGFAKQNYTMLDNLKLGYGGTASEMQRLLDDATKISGIDYDISSLSDVYEAIHVIQTELDITGTTAAESSSTISGSIGTMKAAWDNLVTGIANPDADMGALIENVVSTATDAAGNLLPAISTALSGVGQLITGLAPQIASAIPGLISEVLPTLSGAALSLLQAAVTSITESLPMLLETGLSVVIELANGIAAAIPELIPTIVGVVLQIVETLTNPDTLSSLVEAAIAIIMGLANGLIAALPQLLAQAPVIIQNLVTALISNIPLLIQAAFQLIIGLVTGIITNLPQIISAAGEIILTLGKALLDLASQLWEAGKNIVNGIWEGIKNTADWLWNQVKGFFSNVLQKIKDFLGIASPSKVFAEIGHNMGAGLELGIEAETGAVEKAVGDMAAAAVGAWNADQLDTELAVRGSYGFTGRGGQLASGTTPQDTADIISAVMAVGNMIVAAINEAGFNIELDGETVSRKLLPYNQAELLRVGPAMVK